MFFWTKNCWNHQQSPRLMWSIILHDKRAMSIPTWTRQGKHQCLVTSTSSTIQNWNHQAFSRTQWPPLDAWCSSWCSSCFSGCPFSGSSKQLAWRCARRVTLGRLGPNDLCGKRQISATERLLALSQRDALCTPMIDGIWWNHIHNSVFE